MSADVMPAPAVGLTPREEEVLHLIEESGATGKTQYMLKRELELTPEQVGRSIDRLQAAGRVTLRKDGLSWYWCAVSEEVSAKDKVEKRAEVPKPAPAPVMINTEASPPPAEDEEAAAWARLEPKDESALDAKIIELRPDHTIEEIAKEIGENKNHIHNRIKVLIAEGKIPSKDHGRHNLTLRVDQAAQEAPAEAPAAAAPVDGIACKICKDAGQEFVAKSPLGMSIHLSKHHGIRGTSHGAAGEVKEPKAEAKPGNCRYCGKELATPSGLGGHEVYCKENPDRQLAPGERAKLAKQSAGQPQVPVDTSAYTEASTEQQLAKDDWNVQTPLGPITDSRTEAEKKADEEIAEASPQLKGFAVVNDGKTYRALDINGKGPETVRPELTGFEPLFQYEAVPVQEAKYPKAERYFKDAEPAPVPGAEEDVFDRMYRDVRELEAKGKKRGYKVTYCLRKLDTPSGEEYSAAVDLRGKEGSS